MTLHEAIKAIEDVEQNLFLEDYYKRRNLDQWIIRTLHETKDIIWWGNFQVAAPYCTQIEALKLRGLI